jgi:hypothetical protein
MRIQLLWKKTNKNPAVMPFLESARMLLGKEQAIYSR